MQQYEVGVVAVALGVHGSCGQVNCGRSTMGIGVLSYALSAFEGEYDLGVAFSADVLRLEASAALDTCRVNAALSVLL